MTAPFAIVRPAAPTPLLYDSPHSGRLYPPDFVLGAPLIDVRRGEDAYVDELLAGAPAAGATLLTATYPRCYIDLNRDERDIDAALLAEPWPEPLAPTEKSARGLGLIRRFVVPGVEAQGRLLTVREVRARIDDVYRPYHAALDALVGELRARFGDGVARRLALDEVGGERDDAGRCGRRARGLRRLGPTGRERGARTSPRSSSTRCASSDIPCR